MSLATELRWKSEIEKGSITCHLACNLIWTFQPRIRATITTRHSTVRDSSKPPFVAVDICALYSHVLSAISGLRCNKCRLHRVGTSKLWRHWRVSFERATCSQCKAQTRKGCNSVSSGSIRYVIIYCTVSTLHPESSGLSFDRTLIILYIAVVAPTHSEVSNSISSIHTSSRVGRV